MARKRAALAAVSAVALACASAAVAGNGGIAPPSSATPSGSSIREVYWIIFGICGGIFVLVEAALLTFIVRFRRRRGTAYETEGPQIHESRRLELAWTAVPVLLVVAIAVVAILKVPGIEASAKAGDNALRVRVESHQFYWQYVYPNGAITLDRLRLPAGRKATLELTSLDVAHSWWAPELAGKRDAIPGRVNRLSFVPTRTGVYEGKCAEFCGIQHAFMTTEVEVMEAAAFDAWVRDKASAQARGHSGLGRETFAAVCSKCHGPVGEGDIGPAIQGNARLTDPQALRDLLLAGQDTSQFPGYMPAVGLGWPERQFAALVAYVKATPQLSRKQGGSPSGG